MKTLGRTATLAIAALPLVAAMALVFPGYAMALTLDKTFIEKGAVVAVASGSLGEATASCPSGDVATGGGDSTSVTTSTPPSLAVSDSFPLPRGLANGGTPTGWDVFAFNPTGTSLNLVAFVVCQVPAR